MQLTVMFDSWVGGRGFLLFSSSKILWYVVLLPCTELPRWPLRFRSRPKEMIAALGDDVTSARERDIQHLMHVL